MQTIFKVFSRPQNQIHVFKNVKNEMMLKHIKQVHLQNSTKLK